MELCVGLFGTCGSSVWRDLFMKEYKEKEITFFNPNITDREWVPEDAIAEAEHLAKDSIILFPITSETYASGSLSEVGFSILNAINLDDQRDFVVMIDQYLDEELQDNVVAVKESLRSRALVKEHLKKLRLSNLYVVDNLKDMLDVSIQLYEAAKICVPLQKYNPHRGE